MGSYFGNYRQRPGMMSSPKRPEAIQPVPEEYEGTNFPYRGSQNHGVEPTPGVDHEAYYDNNRHDDGPENIPFLPEEKEPEPIPVKVVTDSARERLDWRAVQYTVTDRAQQILGRHDKRKCIRIKNLATADGGKAAYVGRDNMVTTYTGYLIPSGTDIYPITSTEEVWAVCKAGETTTLFIMYEFAVEL